MALQVTESPGACFVSISGLSSWPKQGIEELLIGEDHNGSLQGLEPFEKDLVGSGMEAILVRHSAGAKEVFRFERDLIGPKANDKLRADYLGRLQAFPRSLPQQIVAPARPVFLRLGNKELIIGQTQRYIPAAVELHNYLNPVWRSQRQFGNAPLTRVLLSVFDGIEALHAAGVLRVDWNPANLGVVGETVYFFDNLSAEFGGFRCATVFPAYLAPWLINQNTKLVESDEEAWKLTQPYTRLADHFAFTAMVFRAFTGTGPWGGKHREAAQRPELRGSRARSILRVPVTSPSVIADWKFPPEVMGERLHNFCHEVFQNGYRGPFPRALLGDLEWEWCDACSTEYAGYACPCYRSKRRFRPIESAAAILSRFRAGFRQRNASA